MSTTPPAFPLVVVLVLYHPPQELKSRLEKLLDAGIPVALYNNTPAQTADWALMLAPRCWWYGGDGQNRGLGIGMAALMQAVKDGGRPWAWYVDQDTRFELETVQWLVEKLQQPPHPLERVAAIQAVATGEPHRALPAKLLINSGTLFQVGLQQGWGHDPRFFVECVDYKFCLDAAFHGYTLWRWHGCPAFDHDSLQPLVFYRWRSFSWTYRQYPLRRHAAFMGQLGRLTLWALGRQQGQYAAIFARNLLTHLLTQAQALLLWAAEQLGLVKKCVSL